MLPCVSVLFAWYHIADCVEWLGVMMFGKFFSRKKPVAEDAGARKAALLDAALENARATDPIVHLRAGAEEVVLALRLAMTTEHGVHIDSLLAAVGSLGGFCCVDSALMLAAAVNRDPRDCGIVDVETTDGNRYYFGNPINSLLAEANISFGALVVGMINQLGSRDYPDFADIAKHVAETIGTPEFGHPRVPEQHRPGDLPINYVRAFWPQVLPLVERRVPKVLERVTLFGLAAQKVIKMGKDVIPPPVAGKLMMECAVPMAKLDPARLWA